MLVAILLLFIILVLLFSIPAVQTALAGSLIENLNEKFGTDMQVKKVGLSYDGTIWLKDVLILDQHQDTLIYAGEARTFITSLASIYAGKPDLGNVFITDLTFDIKRYEGEDRDNFAKFTHQFQTDTLPKKNDFRLRANHVAIASGRFSYVDQNLATPTIIDLKNLNIDASNFMIDGSEISVNIATMNADESRGFRIENLSAAYFYSPTGMNAEDLVLQTPTSEIHADIALDYTLENFADFENKVDFDAVFENSTISLADLNHFYEGFGANEALVLNTNLNGTLNNFRLTNLDLRGMDRSVINGNLRVQGLFSDSGKDLMISGEVDHLSSNYYDLIQLLPQDLRSLPETLQNLGNVRLEGFVEVTPTTVTTDSKIFSQLGAAVVDLQLGDLNDPDFATYKGKIKTDSLDLGKLLDIKSLGNTSFNLEVDGVGFTQETLNTHVKGKIHSLVFNGYRYKNISILGVLIDAVFNGKLVGNDPNLRFKFNGILDASDAVNYYNFELGISYADLFALNIVDRDSLSIFKGDISMNMKGTSINDAIGTILFKNTMYKNRRDTYLFEQLEITSSFNADNEHHIEINSPDVINGKVEGRFNVKEIPALFHNAIASLYTNYEPTVITTDQYLDFNFDIYNKIVEVFFPKIELAPNTFIKGSVESNNSEFELTFKSPKIEAFDNMLEEVNVRVDNTNPLFNMYVEIDSVATDVYSISDFNLINVTLRDTLFIRTEFKGGEKNNDVFNLSLYHTINENNQSVVGIRKSNIKFKENIWYLNKEKNASNRIIFDDNFRDLRVDSLVMSHEDQEIRLSGVKRDSTYKDFKVVFENVDLEKITPAVKNLKLEGVVNGKVHLLQKRGVYFPRTSLEIVDLAINDDPYGDLLLDIEGNESLTNYTIHTVLKDYGYEFMKAEGTIDVSGKNSYIDLDVALQNLKLSAFSALGEEVITDIRGVVSGNATVTGEFNNLDIDGELILENAGLRIPYLNVDFDFQERSRVHLSGQQFQFDHITLTDTEYGTQGILTGTIAHENFKNWELDLNVATDRMLALDTEASQTSLYYGTAFIRGNASISGPTDELVINVDATTEKGTIFKIPLKDTQTIGDNSYIYFLSPDEKKAKLEGKDIFIKEVKGLEINFDLNVTNDALVEIVVDPVTGSTLRGRGAGILRIEINTNGKFNMWGDFVVYDGVYNFKYAGLIHKEFEVQRGGSINWNGSPVRADLNVRAVYSTMANPAVLLENPGFNRKIPVNVVINLEGQIVQPEITFDIQYPNLSSVVKSELEYKINDRQSAELQAFALITTGSFYSEIGAGPNAVTGNLLERASSLVNDIFEDDNEKFSLGLSYVQGDHLMDQSVADRFGLTVSTQISENIVFRGQVGVPIGGVSESLIIGNAEINFLLNEEGTLRFKIFNRENNIRYIGEEIGYTQGVGLSYSVDFDTFEELVRKILNKEIKPEEISKEIKSIREQRESVAPDYLKFPGEQIQ